VENVRSPRAIRQGRLADVDEDPALSVPALRRGRGHARAVLLLVRQVKPEAVPPARRGERRHGREAPTVLRPSEWLIRDRQLGRAWIHGVCRRCRRGRRRRRGCGRSVVAPGAARARHAGQPNEACGESTGEAYGARHSRLASPPKREEIDHFARRKSTGSRPFGLAQAWSGGSAMACECSERRLLDTLLHHLFVGALAARYIPRR
jgi:hypothetical protein